MAGPARSCLTISKMTSHLGINPDRGGRPPRESNRGVNMVAIEGDFVQEVARSFRLVQLKSFKVKNATEVIATYKKRLRRAREGANCIIKTIQPKWAIDEYARILRSCV